MRGHAPAVERVTCSSSVHAGSRPPKPEATRHLKPHLPYEVGMGEVDALDCRVSGSKATVSNTHAARQVGSRVASSTRRI